MFDGQLYFTGGTHLVLAMAFLGAVAGVLPWLSRNLLLERMFPGYLRASGLSARKFHLLFDVLVAAGLALATASIGVMGAFGMVFVPSMIAYQVGPSWRSALWVATGIGAAVYGVAFLLALSVDQPFGPVLVLVLLSVAVFGYLMQLAQRRAAPDFADD